MSGGGLIAEIWVKFNADVAPLQRQITSAQQTMDRAGRNLQTTGRNVHRNLTQPLIGAADATKPLGAGMDSVARRAQAAGGVLLGTGGAAATAASKISGLGATTEGVRKSTDRATKSTVGLGHGFGTLGRAAAGFFAVSKVKQELDGMVLSASNLEQAVGGTRAVFDGSGRVINAWAQDSADAVGLSEAAFREGTTLIGSALKRMTGDVQFAADSSVELVRIAADAAATFGGTTAEAVNALAAAYRGEADPAERFGFGLNINAVKAYALSQGITDLESNTAEYARVLTDMIREQAAATGALGQFEREADTAAGATQRYKALQEDLNAATGASLGFYQRGTNALGLFWAETKNAASQVDTLGEGLRLVFTGHLPKAANQVESAASSNRYLAAQTRILDAEGRRLVGSTDNLSAASLHYTHAAERRAAADRQAAFSIEKLSKAQQAAIAGIQSWAEPLAGYSEALAAANDAGRKAFDERKRQAEDLQRFHDQMRDAERTRNRSIEDARQRHHETIREAERKLSETLIEANRTRNEQLLELERRAAQERSQIIRDRQQEIFDTLQLQIDLDDVLVASTRNVTDQVIRQNRELQEWIRGLDMLRRRGVSEATIAALGLDQFSQESLAIIRGFSAASQAEVNKLNAAIAQRQKLAGEQARKEARTMVGAVGEALREVARETAAETAKINADHAKAVASAHREFASAVSKANQDLAKALSDASETFSEAVDRISEELARKNEAERGSAASTARMYTDMEASFDAYSRSLDRRLADQREWHANLNHIREVAGHEYADMLMAQGMEQADLVAEIAKQRDSVIRNAAKRENTFISDNLREQLGYLLRHGQLAVTETGRLTKEQVKKLAAELGVAPGKVERIWEQIRRKQTQKMKAMSVLAVNGAGQITDNFGQTLDKGQVNVSKVMRQYVKDLKANLDPVIIAVGGKALVMPRHRAQRVYQAVSRSGTGPGIARNAGGPIPGAGPDRDSVPVLATPGEHMWTRSEVRAVGGHAAMERLRKMALAGEIQGLRVGGVVGPGRTNLNPQFLQAFTMWSNWLQKQGTVPGGLSITSGWRSRAQQAALYAAKPNLAAPPGRSNHEDGLAIDHAPWSWAWNRTAGRFGMVHPMSHEGWHVEPKDLANMKAMGALLAMPKLPKVPDFPANGIARSAPKAAKYVRQMAKKWLEQQILSPLNAVGMDTAASGSLQNMAQEMLRSRGWATYWGAFKTLVSKESSWNPRAQNPTSTAFGLGQFLDSTWATVGGRKTSDPALQLEYMMRYIAQRYGNPAKALAFHLRNNWYDSGGLLMPGTTMATNATGQPEIVAAQGMIATEVSKGITEALSGKLPSLPKHTVSSRKMAPAEYEQAVARNIAAFELGIISLQDHLKNLAKRMERTVPYSDEWMALFRERQSLVDDLLDEHIRNVEDKLQAQDEAFDELNRLLDERSDVLKRIDEQLDRRNDIIADRAKQFLDALDPQARIDRAFANSIGSVTRNIQSQVEAFTQWAEGVDLLRSLGLSEDAVGRLGLDQFTADSLATVQSWAGATESEIAALNAAIAAQQQAANARAQTEADQMLGSVGESLTAWQSELDALTSELAAIGSEQGRSYAQALAEALDSGIPGIVAAAERAQKAISEVQTAEKGLAQARRIAEKNPAAGTTATKAPLARLYKVKNVGFAVRMADATWWSVGDSVLPYARKLWGPALSHPPLAADRIDGGIVELLGPGTLQRFTKPNVQPRYFAQGGIVSRPMVVGEAGEERLRIDPLSRDVTTPHEKRMEAKTDRLIAAIERALDREDVTVVLDTGVIAGAVTRRQDRHARSERVAAGTSTWRS